MGYINVIHPKRGNRSLMQEAPTSDLAIVDENKSEDEKNEVQEALAFFVHNIDSLMNAIPIVMTVVLEFFDQTKGKFTTLRDDSGNVVEDNGDYQTVEFPIDKAAEAEKLSRGLERIASAIDSTPKAYTISLVSIFDAYVSSLLRAIYHKRPVLMINSEKTIQYKDLSDFESLDEIKETFIEKEIDSIVRENITKQFSYMENRFGLPLRKDLKVWPTFIEVIERRHLFTHTDGRVNKQYLSTCEEAGVSTNDLPSLGTRLGAGPEYFENAVEAIFEVGFKLGHVLWRKVLPHERKQADQHFNSTCFDLIRQKRYKIASDLLEFSLDNIKKHYNQRGRLVQTINLCNCYRLQGNEGKCLTILDSIDFTALSDDFRLAEAVLRGKYTDAAEIMKYIGPSGSVHRIGYHIWPLFDGFRETDEFRSTYETVYGEPFKVETTNKTSGEDGSLQNQETKS